MPPHCNAEDVVQITPSMKETRKLEQKPFKYLEIWALQNFTRSACRPRWEHNTFMGKNCQRTEI